MCYTGLSIQAQFFLMTKASGSKRAAELLERPGYRRLYIAGLEAHRKMKQAFSAEQMRSHDEDVVAFFHDFHRKTSREEGKGDRP